MKSICCEFCLKSGCMIINSFLQISFHCASDTAGGIFAEESTTEQWLLRGDEFMKHSLYEVAAKCFNRGKNFHMEKIARAHQLALVASRFV